MSVACADFGCDFGVTQVGCLPLLLLLFRQMLLLLLHHHPLCFQILHFPSSARGDDDDDGLGVFSYSVGQESSVDFW